MNVAQMILDFVVAIAWPAIAAVGLAILWPTLKGVLPRVRSVKAGGFDLNLADDAETILQEAVSASHAAPEDGDRGEGDSAPFIREKAAVFPAGNEEVRLTRDALESVISSFAAAGWAKGASGDVESQPVPVISWSDDGIPTVTDWSEVGSGSAARSDVDRDRAREIEQQIIEVAAGSRGPIYDMTAPEEARNRREKLKVLRRALRKVDPLSPFAYEDR